MPLIVVSRGKKLINFGKQGLQAYENEIKKHFYLFYVFT